MTSDGGGLVHRELRAFETARPSNKHANAAVKRICCNPSLVVFEHLFAASLDSRLDAWRKSTQVKPTRCLFDPSQLYWNFLFDFVNSRG